MANYVPDLDFEIITIIKVSQLFDLKVEMNKYVILDTLIGITFGVFCIALCWLVLLVMVILKNREYFYELERNLECEEAAFGSPLPCQKFSVSFIISETKSIIFKEAKEDFLEDLDESEIGVRFDNNVTRPGILRCSQQDGHPTSSRMDEIGSVVGGVQKEKDDDQESLLSFTSDQFVEDEETSKLSPSPPLTPALEKKKLKKTKAKVNKPKFITRASPRVKGKFFQELKTTERRSRKKKPRLQSKKPDPIKNSSFQVEEEP